MDKGLPTVPLFWPLVSHDKKYRTWQFWEALVFQNRKLILNAVVELMLRVHADPEDDLHSMASNAMIIILRQLY